jgi:hypothetical protein
MCPVRGPVREIYDSELLHEPLGRSDVNEIFLKTCVLTFFWGSTVSEASPARLLRIKLGTKYLKTAGHLDHFLLFGPSENVLR